jgi:hypothetical protein
VNEKNECIGEIRTDFFYSSRSCLQDSTRPAGAVIPELYGCRSVTAGWVTVHERKVQPTFDPFQTAVLGLESIKYFYLILISSNL